MHRPFPPVVDKEWVATIEVLKSDRPAVALKAIANKIQFTDPQIALRLPFDDICQRLDDILTQSTTYELIELTTECLYKIADALDNAFELYSKTQILQTMCQLMIKKTNQKIIENCLRTFITISKMASEGLCKTIGIDPIIKVISMCSLIEQKDAFVALSSMTEKYVTSQMAWHLPVIAQFFTEHDLRLVTHAIKTFNNIAMKVDSSEVQTKVISQVAVSLLVVTDINSVLTLLTDLCKFMDNAGLVQALITSPISFEVIILQTQTNSREMDLFSKLIALIHAVLKSAVKLKSHRQFDGINNFIYKAYPVIVDVLTNHRGAAKMSLESVKFIMKLNPETDISQLYESFTGYAIDNGLVKNILDIAMNVANQDTLAKSPIPSILIGARKRLTNESETVKKIDNFLNSLDSNGIHLLKEIKSIESFDKLHELLIDQNMPLYNFVNIGGIEAATKFLTEYKGPINVREEDILAKLVQAAHSVLVGFPVPHEQDLFGSERNQEFEKKSITVDIEMPREMGIEKFRCEITIDFAAIEAYYNQRKLNFRFDIMRAAFDRDQTIKNHLNLLDETIQYSKLSVLNRVANTPGYKRCSFKIGNQIFSTRDNLFQSICKVIKDPDSIKEKCPKIQIIEKDSPSSPFDLYSSKKIPPPLVPSLSLLKIIHQLSPDMNLVCQAFSDHISLNLASIANIVGGFSVSASLIYHFPYIFDLKHRILFFKELAFDLPTSFYSMYIEFIKPDSRRSDKFIKYYCSVQRENIAQEGANILKAFGPSMGVLEVKFKGEQGMGYGPTQEFFTLFSHEMCRVSRRLWRNTGNSGEFAFSDTGLYPAPTASPEDLRVLGILCAKALQTQFIVDLPFSRHFIRTLRGEIISVKDVDPTLATSLSMPEGLIGLDFTYPGISDLPLIVNGQDVEITESNVNNYVERIVSYTCGEWMINLCKNFVNGFNEVMPWEPTLLFTPDELIQMWSGRHQKITYDDLVNNVEVGTGHKKDSPVINNFFQVIDEMSESDQKLLVKFITGTEKLPIGGLASLQPKLTIAERIADRGASIDECLPSVMTCFNYFKLPMYSSKEILRERLMTAITDGQGSFDLT